MAPEQARGEVDAVDERADVFALGSILCEVLTGAPAFVGRTVGEIQRKAAAGELADAIGRLDASGAEAELVALARDCLAPEPADRPRDAGAVSERVTAYLAGVQERLRAAEVARAAEAARAAEGRPDRRGRAGGPAGSTVALAASILGAGRPRRAAAPPGSPGPGPPSGRGPAPRSSRPWPWPTASAARPAPPRATRPPGPSPWRRPVRRERLLGPRPASTRRSGIGSPRSSPPCVRERDAAEADRRLRTDLEVVSDSWATNAGPEQLDADYAAAFRAAGLDLDATDPIVAGDWLAGRGDPVELAAAPGRLGLGPPPCRPTRGPTGGGWSPPPAPPTPTPGATPSGSTLEADDPGATATFLALADDAEALDAQPAESLLLLASQLRHVVGDLGRAEAVLRRAWERFPGAFWVNHELADAARHAIDLGDDPAARRAEAIRYLTAAVAIRPDSDGACNYLGNILSDAGRPAEAAAAYRAARRLDPENATYGVNLGHALAAAGDLDGALDAFDDVIARHPDDPWGHANRGGVLWTLGDLDGALASAREAARLDPRSARFRSDLGETLLAVGAVAEAEAAYREALRLDPDPADYAALRRLAGGWITAEFASLRESLDAGSPGAAADVDPGHRPLANRPRPGPCPRPRGPRRPPRGRACRLVLLLGRGRGPPGPWRHPPELGALGPIA